MSAYDNDPRVHVLGPHNIEVEVSADDRQLVYFWPALAVWRSEWDLATLPALSADGFDTADEAIRSLIGDPQC